MFKSLSLFGQYDVNLTTKRQSSILEFEPRMDANKREYEFSFSLASIAGRSWTEIKKAATHSLDAAFVRSVDRY